MGFDRKNAAQRAIRTTTDTAVRFGQAIAEKLPMDQACRFATFASSAKVMKKSVIAEQMLPIMMPTTSSTDMPLTLRAKIRTTPVTSMEPENAAAITALESVSLENTSSSYADIERMYQEANYLYANQLYDQKKPYEALPYYRNIPEYKDVAKKLDRVCYRMLGKWVSLTGVRMEFREDGTCTIDGKDYYFRGTTFAFYVGNSPDELTGEWMIYDCQGDNLSIQNIKTKSQYKLTREKE